MRELGKLILAARGRSRPFLHLPVPLCRALAIVLGRVMKDPPLTPYAIAGFINDADLDCAQAVADLGYPPRGVREGLARCLPTRRQLASRPTPLRPMNRLPTKDRTMRDPLNRPASSFARLSAVVSAARRSAAAPPWAPGRPRQRGEPGRAAQKLMDEVGGKANGTIVWSSSRLGNHDLFTMNTDGSDVKPITHGDAVDWFPRFSPDGAASCSPAARRAGSASATPTPAGSGTSTRSAPTARNETKVVDNAQLGKLDLARRDRLRARHRDRSPQARRRRRDRDRRQHEGARARRRAAAAAGAVERRQVHRHHAARVEARDRHLEHRKKTWTHTGLGCQINWTPDGRRSTGCTRPATAAAACFTCRSRTASRPRATTTSTAHVDRHPGAALARVLSAAVAGRQVDGLGRHAARARPRHRRLRDLPVGGGHAARDRRRASPTTRATTAGPTSSSRAGAPLSRDAELRRPGRKQRPGRRGRGPRRWRWSVRLRIAVLGAGGFIGSHLVPRLAARPRTEIDAVDVDLRQARARAAAACGASRRASSSPACSTSSPAAPTSSSR